MRLKTLTGRFVLCAAVLAAVPPALQAQPAPAAAAAPAKASVADLAWVAGAWTGTLGDRIVEQHWSAPAADSIVAMYRSIRDGKVTLYELLAIEKEGEGVVLRIKHFAPGSGLVGQEAKDQSMDHVLIRLDGKTAVFQGGTAASPVQVTFNSPDPSALNIVVQRTRDGKPISTEFKYTRIAATR